MFLNVILPSISALWFLVGVVASDFAQAQLSTPGSTPSTKIKPAPQNSVKALDKLKADLWQEHQISIILAGLVLGSYLGVLGLKPIWLLKIPSTDISVPWTSWKIPLGVVRFLKYRNRVLDAWVNQHWKTVQAEFLKLSTVENRKIHISLPVHLDKTPIDNLNGAKLSKIFEKKTVVLLITGEGGTGKTSLACKIAQWGIAGELTSHRMLPVVIENELDEHTSLLEAIRGQLSALANLSEPLSAESLEKLLQHQRILVIVDHLSEVNKMTRSQVKPELADFPVKALIVTSRVEETLGGIPKSTLQPLKIQTERLWAFMSAYLTAKEKQALFEDDQYATGCNRLRRMSGERRITVLLARLYIDHMIQEQEGAGGILPDSVPKLMLSYLNQLNRNIELINKQDDLAIQRDAKIIAWECLKQSYRPTSVKKVDAIAALNIVKNPTNAKDRLDYLEKRLQFLKTLEPGDRIRIILDPLAEYLAALYLLERNCQDNDSDAAWHRFFEDIDYTLEKSEAPPDVVRGFLLALRDCCLDAHHKDELPEQLSVRLERKAGLDPEELRRAQEKRRIQRLIADLSEPDLQDRLRALEELGNYGAIAKIAEPNLIGMLENKTQTPVARQAAAKTLGDLGLGYDALIALLRDQDEVPNVRRSAAEALGILRASRKELLEILDNPNQPLLVRQGAARALNLIGAPSGRPIPMLVVVKEYSQVKTQVIHIPVWKYPLTSNTTLDLVAIPEGSFTMGSPQNEEGRKNYINDLCIEPRNVETQHQVHVSPFYMSQFPITQAQWKAVAALPKINCDLKPEQSQFKGANRPVEEVLWHEAVEFCARLSQYFNHPYRLPSEAEWEYACRAGINNPFHLGDTLSTDLANYDGRYTYGCGVRGEYRSQTTECGAFGVVNSFGLADMHGNVLEWCLDHWHPDYIGAPNDGSPWLFEKKDSLRWVLRGGSWADSPIYCRSAFRHQHHSQRRFDRIGFRVCCSKAMPP